MMVNLPKPSKTTQSYRPTDKPVLECSYCHGKNHTREKCYKLVGYSTDHAYHPNNRGKKEAICQNSTCFWTSHSNN